MIKQPDKLLAKSRLKTGEMVSLEKHLLDTEQAARQIFRLDGRWGKNWCRFFRIQSRDAQERFLLNLRVAALFHDLGKANEDFYEAVSQTGFKLQTLRHEHISALLLCLPQVKRWLSQNGILDVDVVTASVLSHHIKAAENGDWQWCQPVGRKVLPLYLNHPEVFSTLKRIAEIARLAGMAELPSGPWSERVPWSDAWLDGIRSARRFGREIRSNRERLALLLAVKAGVIVADAAASGLVREGHSIDNWIEEKVHSSAIDTNDIADAIITPRAKQISERRGEAFDFHPFQLEIAKQGSRVLLVAACAAGKTLAAWKWAEAQGKRASRRC